MKKGNVVSWLAGILTVCIFLLLGTCGLHMRGVATASERYGSLPDSFTVTTGNTTVKMWLSSYYAGDIASLVLNENTQTDFLFEDADMIYFEGLNSDGTGDGMLVPFHFRYDGQAWQTCTDSLILEQLEGCEKLELFVGELPLETYTVIYLIGAEEKCVTVSDGERLEEWIPPLPVGMKFSGWYLDGLPYDFSLTVHRNMTLTAVFEKEVFRLTYCIDGNEWVTESYEYGTEIELKKPYEKERYRFIGWEGISDPHLIATEHLRLNAVWMKIYTVSFYSEDTFIEERVVDEGTTVSELPAPEREGLRFTGWYHDNTEYDFSSPVFEDLTLVAHYEPLLFQVVFYVNGKIFLTAICEYLQTLELPKPTPPTGERFVGWQDEDGRFASNDDPVTTDLSLTAVFEIIQVTIRFFVERNLIAESLVFYGDPCILPEAPQFTGRQFLHWSETENGSEYSFSSTWTEENDCVFYAVYLVFSYTISYLAENVRTEGPATGEYGEEITFSLQAETGFRITKIEIFYHGAWEELSAPSFLMPDDDVQIRVTAEIYSYTLEVVAEGQSYYVEVNQPFIPPLPVREHQLFLGWYTDSDFMQPYDGIITGSEGEPIYLYAKFDAVKFTITFRAGEQEESTLWEYGQTPVPSFVPWENDSTKRFVKWSPSVATATEDTTYVAVYESLFTKIYLDGEREILRETVPLRESAAPTLNREGYLFEGFLLVRQESETLYYCAQFSELPKAEEPPDTTTPSPTTDSNPTTPSQNSISPVWILLSLISISAWIIFLVAFFFCKRKR